jgi:hypothetical protein
MSEQANQVLAIRAVSAGKPVLDRSLIRPGPLHDGLDRLMRVAELSSQASSDR